MWRGLAAPKLEGGGHCSYSVIPPTWHRNYRVRMGCKVVWAMISLIGVEGGTWKMLGAHEMQQQKWVGDQHPRAARAQAFALWN